MNRLHYEKIIADSIYNFEDCNDEKGAAAKPNSSPSSGGDNNKGDGKGGTNNGNNGNKESSP